MELAKEMKAKDNTTKLMEKAMQECQIFCSHVHFTCKKVRQNTGFKIPILCDANFQRLKIPISFAGAETQ